VREVAAPHQEAVLPAAEAVALFGIAHHLGDVAVVDDVHAPPASTTRRPRFPTVPFRARSPKTASPRISPARAAGPPFVSFGATPSARSRSRRAGGGVPRTRWTGGRVRRARCSSSPWPTNTPPCCRA